MKNLLLPATIIIASLILGGFFYASQVNKQQSIERQQQIKIEQEKQEAEANQAKQDAIIQAETTKTEQEKIYSEQQEEAFEKCMIAAHDNYVKAGDTFCLNAGYTQTEIDNLKCSLPGQTGQNLLDTQEKAQNLCFKLYK